jgi:Skp family chaperone for outer membrane proteins
MNDNMKTSLLLISIFAACFCYAQLPYSKQNKIAVFDIDLMVEALPEYAKVDSLVKIYEQDTLAAEYELLQKEYKVSNSYFISDIDYADIKSIDSISQIKQEIAMKLVCWQQYAQGKDSIKRRTLADPLYKRVRTAFYKVVSNKNYDVILKPNAIEFANNINNLFIKVGKELRLFYLPIELLQIRDTDLNPVPKHTALQTNGSLTEEQAVKHNTLQPKAFCISEDRDRWNIGFLSVGVDLSKLDSLQRQANLSGRAVTIMKEKKEIKIAHKEPFFFTVQKAMTIKEITPPGVVRVTRTILFNIKL